MVNFVSFQNQINNHQSVLNPLFVFFFFFLIYFARNNNKHNQRGFGTTSLRRKREKEREREVCRHTTQAFGLVTSTILERSWKMCVSTFFKERPIREGVLDLSPFLEILGIVIIVFPSFESCRRIVTSEMKLITSLLPHLLLFKLVLSTVRSFLFFLCFAFSLFLSQTKKKGGKIQ